MIIEAIKRDLAHVDLSLEDFQRVIQRLLANQVLYRDPENRTEREIYDAFEKMDDLVTDYLEAMGLTLVHRADQHFAVVYPPGAEHPYQSEPDTRAPSLRARVSKEDSALLLVCRMRYEDALRAGETNEEDEALVSLEDIYTSYRMVAKESMSEQKGQRERAFQRLRRHRLIDYMTLDNEDALVKIRPTILALTLSGFVEAARELTGDEALSLDRTETSSESAVDPALRADGEDDYDNEEDGSDVA